MAISPTERLTAILFHQSKKVADNFTYNCGLVRRLKSRGKMRTISGGYEIREPIAYQENSNFEWIDENETVSTAGHKHLTAFTYEPAYCTCPVVISQKEIAMCQGPEQLVNLYESRIENAQNTMLNQLSVGVYSDGSASGGLQLDGLQKLVAITEDSGTVGGYDRATYSWARNVSIDSTTDLGAAMSASNAIAQMSNVWARIVRGNDQPDLIPMNNAAWGFYHAALSDMQRIVDLDSDVAKAGFPTLKFMRAEVILDGGFGSATGGIDAIDTAATAYFLNTKYLKLNTWKGMNFEPIGPKKRAPHNQLVHSVLTVWMGALSCSNFQLQAILND